MKWNFDNTRGKKPLTADMRLRINLKSKTPNYSITITQSGYKKMGNPSVYLCFGVGNEGVFVTNKSIGTKFEIRDGGAKGNPNCYYIYGSSLIKEIFKNFNVSYPKGESVYFDCDLVEVDNDVWKLTKVNGKGWL